MIWCYNVYVYVYTTGMHLYTTFKYTYTHTYEFGTSLFTAFGLNERDDVFSHTCEKAYSIVRETLQHWISLYLVVVNVRCL